MNMLKSDRGEKVGTKVSLPYMINAFAEEKTIMRKENIQAVCTNNEAREYFAEKGLSYSDITEGDILVLIMLLNRHIKAAVKDHETSVSSICLSSKIDLKKKTNGSIICCYLYLNSHYFTQRECISFNRDGFIGFAGWADQGNVNPILRAFLEWCDYLAEEEILREGRLCSSI